MDELHNHLSFIKLISSLAYFCCVIVFGELELPFKGLSGSCCGLLLPFTMVYVVKAM